MHARHHIATAVSSAWSLLLDLFYPPRCGGCDRRGTLLCDECHELIEHLDRTPRVERLDAVISAGIFREPLREAIHKLKYQSDTPLAKPLAQLISDALERDYSWIADDGEPPVIVPVPLHPSKRRARGYNQSELLARELARITGWTIVTNLARVKATRPQVGLDADARLENVSEAFQWQGEDAPSRVLLVDDVCTTGATLSECAFALMSAGAEHIFAATVARAYGSGPGAGS